MAAAFSQAVQAITPKQPVEAAVPDMVGLALMTRYRFCKCWLLAADPAWLRLIVLEPLNPDFEDETHAGTGWIPSPRGGPSLGAGERQDEILEYVTTR